MLNLKLIVLFFHHNFCILLETTSKTKNIFELVYKLSSLCEEKALCYSNIVSFKYKNRFNSRNNIEDLQKDSLVTLEMYIRVPVKKKNYGTIIKLKICT